MTLETQLKKYVVDLQSLRDQYKALYDDPKTPDENRDIFRGKMEAYSYSAKDLKAILQWHGIKFD